MNEGQHLLQLCTVYAADCFNNPIQKGSQARPNRLPPQQLIRESAAYPPHCCKVASTILDMQCVLFTPPHTVRKELELVDRMFQAGLSTLHVRKPLATVDELRTYIEAIDTSHRGRVVIHQHHHLAQELQLQVNGPHKDLLRFPGSLLQNSHVALHCREYIGVR
jgi:hypothetical protein